jgi:hypothetical protein
MESAGAGRFLGSIVLVPSEEQVFIKSRATKDDILGLDMNKPIATALGRLKFIQR